MAEGGATPKPKKPKKRLKWKPSSAGPETALLASAAEHESR